ncbi:MAG: hypothetical protein ABEL76_16070 [Bradymonadaceae bacterium]
METSLRPAVLGVATLGLVLVGCGLSPSSVTEGPDGLCKAWIQACPVSRDKQKRCRQEFKASRVKGCGAKWKRLRRCINDACRAGEGENPEKQCKSAGQEYARCMEE